MMRWLEEIDSKIALINDLEKRKVLQSIIAKKDWYKNVSFDTLASILKDIGYTNEQIANIYKSIIKEV